MVSNRGKGLFRLGLAAALVSICLSAYLISHAQSGPSWEVPAAVMSELTTLPWLSLLLAIIAALLYFWSSRQGDLGSKVRRAFVIIVLIAIALPIAVWIFQPEQWAYQFVLLSVLASLLFVPVVIIALLFFWLIGFKWMRPEAK